MWKNNVKNMGGSWLMGMEWWGSWMEIWNKERERGKDELVRQQDNDFKYFLDDFEFWE